MFNVDLLRMSDILIWIFWQVLFKSAFYIVKQVL